MMTISFVNESESTSKKKMMLEKAFCEIFKYVNYGEVDIIFDIVSPTSTIGVIDVLIFINIVDKNRNYYKSFPTGNYLHNLVIGLKVLELDDVTNVDSSELHVEEGSWNYIDELEADSRSFDSFCYSISPEIKYFKSAFFYYIKASNCKKSFENEYIFFNKACNTARLIDYACKRCHSKKYKGTWSMLFSNDMNVHKFIPLFIQEAEDKTKQGILTRKKIDAICKDSVLIEQALNSLGNRLCILKGNAGAGKTLALLRLAYRTVSKEFDKEGEHRSHTVRFLTYNNMLVYDINLVLKSLGTFTPSLLSVQTLHKFFYDMFKNSPAIWAKYSGDIQKRITDLIETCSERIDIINSIIIDAFNYLKTKEVSPYKQIEYYEKAINNSASTNHPIIIESDKKETSQYFDYLISKKLWDNLVIPQGLEEIKKQYVSEKKQNAIENYLSKVFLTDYENILKDMYFLTSDPAKFAEDYNIKSKRDFFQFISTTDIVDEQINTYVEKSAQKIINKAKWSYAFLIDEAQDCSIYEKALLYQTRGPENIIIATGGQDQMIRRPKENDWTVLFGKQLDKEVITLSRTNRRQKANIVKFLNEFAAYYNLKSKQLKSPPETESRGRVILDVREIKQGQIALDKLASLRNQGKDYGCSDYENTIVLLPHKGYTGLNNNDKGLQQRLQMEIDVTDTISFSTIQQRGLNDFGLYKNIGTQDIRICDCTVDSKGKINPGQSDTRFMFYDSCRGLEAWNVMCNRIDDFYYEQFVCDKAKNYAIEMSGFLEEDRDLYQHHYAAIWCYMAFTRPMDTLYMSLNNCNSKFSKELLDIANKCGDAVEIIR